MAKEDLIPMSMRSKEEVKAIASKGGKNSGKSRRRKKATRDIALAFGKEEAPVQVVAKLIQLGMLEEGESCSMDEALMLAQYGKALSGNTKAAEFVRDTSGQKPKDEIEVSTKSSKNLDDIMSQIGGEGLKDKEE